jgi:type IV pilus assembly protein PilW
MRQRFMTPGKAHQARTAQGRFSRGFSLIELMVALLLGLIVSAGVASVFIANQQTYRTNQALGEVQDGTRLAFDMLAHDIRNAQLTGCNNNSRVANVLKNGPANGGTDWWANWGNAITGYTKGQDDPAVTSGTATNQRLNTQDSIELIGADDTVMSVQTHTPSANTITINGTPTNLFAKDVVIACDPDHATIFEITKYSAGTITYDATLNCSIGLGYPTVCVTNGTPYTFGPNSQIAKLTMADWFIGNYTATNSVTGQSVTGQSLYRAGFTNSGTGLTATTQEMVRGVSQMSLTYHQSGATSFVAATAVTSWSLVDAVQIALTLQSSDPAAGTNATSLSRKFTGIVTLRNRVN